MSVQLLRAVSREFEDLLHDKAPLEAYTEWLESMVNRCIILVIITHLLCILLLTGPVIVCNIAFKERSQVK